MANSHKKIPPDEYARLDQEAQEWVLTLRAAIQKYADQQGISVAAIARSLGIQDRSNPIRSIMREGRFTVLSDEDAWIYAVLFHLHGIEEANPLHIPPELRKNSPPRTRAWTQEQYQAWQTNFDATSPLIQTKQPTETVIEHKPDESPVVTEDLSDQPTTDQPAGLPDLIAAHWQLIQQLLVVQVASQFEQRLSELEHQVANLQTSQQPKPETPVDEPPANEIDQMIIQMAALANTLKQFFKGADEQTIASLSQSHKLLIHKLESYIRGFTLTKNQRTVQFAMINPEDDK